jgi:hypothetical protein
MVRAWRDKSELQAHFAISLNTYINVNPRRGWVRAPEAGGADIAQALSNLTEENARLRRSLDEITQLSSTKSGIDNIVDIILGQTLDRSGEKIRGGDFVIDLIKYIHDGDSQFEWLQSILEEFSEYDSAEITNFIKELVILNVLRKGNMDLYGVADIGSQVYAKLVIRK